MPRPDSTLNGPWRATPSSPWLMTHWPSIDWYPGYLGFVPPRKAFRRQQQAVVVAGIVHAQRAIRIDNSRAEVHALMGEFHKTLAYDWPEVRREMALALQLAPTSPLVRLRYAVSADLMPHGRLGRSHRGASKARSSWTRCPSSARAGWGSCWCWRTSGASGRSTNPACCSSSIRPPLGTLCDGRGLLPGKADVREGASPPFATAMDVSGGMPGSIGWLGLTLGLSGTRPRRALCSIAFTPSAAQPVPPTGFACISSWAGRNGLRFRVARPGKFGERGQAIDADRKAIASSIPSASDPRFLDHLRKMNLEP
ncbi:MAG: hypothetical protein MZU84_01905 [Sphingobacterium sp.]|nr:hypothetical protein [Sphingobacterium sp.]